MEQIQEYVSSLTDGNINEIYEFYDSGGYDHLMRYPSTVVPRSDMSYRRKHLIDYLGEYLENPDPDVPNSVLDGTCSFAKFRYTLQLQAIGEPLMHRLNQDTNSPNLEYSEVTFDYMKNEMKMMRDCLEKVYTLLEEILEDGDPCTATVLNRNDRLAEKAKELIEEIL